MAANLPAYLRSAFAALDAHFRDNPIPDGPEGFEETAYEERPLIVAIGDRGGRHASDLIRHLVRVGVFREWGPLYITGARWRNYADRQRQVGKKRRRRGARKLRPLTTKELEAVKIVSEHKGNYTEAAREIGVSRQAVKKRFDAAIKKVPELSKKPQKPGTQRLPRDRRGQEIVPCEEEE
jgi:hypothetical protein